MVRRLLLPVLLALSVPAAAHTVTVNADRAATADVPVLTCADMMVVHIGWDPRPDGAHDVRAVWRNTSTDFSHTTAITTAPGAPASYLWLRFDPSAGAGFARLLGDADDAVGDWTVQLSYDGRPFAEKRFKVQC